MMKIRATARIFSCSGRCAKISLKFTDKEHIFDGLSVSKTHFTDKPSFSGDLSVNFWPLWWRFTDKAGFLETLSVKPGPKHLNFYGQTAIFIGVSVNGSDFAKCSAAHHLLNHCTWVMLRAKRRFLMCSRFARNLRPHCFGEGNRVEHFSNFWRFCSTFGAARAEFGVGGRQKWDISPVFCLLSVPPAPNLESVVDKKETFPSFFVYFRDRPPRIWRVR